MQKGFTLWLTGLSGSGKTTLANHLSTQLQQNGLKVEVLDGDVIRNNINQNLGFSKKDRFTNLKLVTFVAKLLTRNDIIVIASFISPYTEMRSHSRNEIDNFIEVYVKCPLEVLIKRDTKGLYKKALVGEIANFTGISDPYEEPSNPEIIIETNKETVKESTEQIITWLIKREYIPANG